MKDKISYCFCMFCLGTMSIFVKAIELNSAQIALCRSFLAVTVIGVYLFCRKQKLFQKFKSPKDAIVIFVSGAFMGLNWVMLFEAFKYTSVAVATLCYYTAPILITILSSVIFGEQLTPKNVLCFSLSTIGLVLILFQPNQDANITGILLGLGAAVLYALIVIINKGLSRYDSIYRTLMQFEAAFVVLLIYVLITTDFVSSFKSLSLIGFGALFILSAFHTGFCYCIFFQATKTLKGHEIAILGYIDPFIAVLCSTFVLKEPITVNQIIGAILLIGFAVLNEIKLNKPKKNNPKRGTIDNS